MIILFALLSAHCNTISTVAPSTEVITNVPTTQLEETTVETSVHSTEPSTTTTAPLSSTVVLSTSNEAFAEFSHTQPSPETIQLSSLKSTSGITSSTGAESTVGSSEGISEMSMSSSVTLLPSKSTGIPLHSKDMDQFVSTIFTTNMFHIITGTGEIA